MKKQPKEYFDKDGFLHARRRAKSLVMKRKAEAMFLEDDVIQSIKKIGDMVTKNMRGSCVLSIEWPDGLGTTKVKIKNTTIDVNF